MSRRSVRPRRLAGIDPSEPFNSLNRMTEVGRNLVNEGLVRSLILASRRGLPGSFPLSRSNSVALPAAFLRAATSTAAVPNPVTMPSRSTAQYPVSRSASSTIDRSRPSRGAA